MHVRHRHATARGAVLLALPLVLAALSGCVDQSPQTVTTSPGRPSVASSAPASAPASSAAAHVTVPDLRGVNAAMARDQLARRGLKKVSFASVEPGVRFVIQSADWHVTKQSTAAGATVAAGSGITLDVRKGIGTAGSGPPPGKATMPAVVGEDGSAALGALKAVGCWKAVLGSADPGHQMVINPSGWKVTEQLVPAGRRFDPDSVVVLAVRKSG